MAKRENKTTAAEATSTESEQIPGLGKVGDVAAKWVDVAWVKRWDRNPRINAKTVEKVASSIRRFGFGAPLICRSSGVLIAGDTRIQAAHLLAMKTVPVRVMDHLSDDEADALAIADNRLAEGSAWNEPQLAQLLAKLDADLLRVVGFAEADLARIHGRLRRTEKASRPYPDDVVARTAFDELRASGFPYRRVDAWEAMREINELSQLDDPTSSILGYIVADTYHPHRMHAAAEGKRSPIESFGIDTSLRKACDMAVANGSSVYSALQLVNGTQACSNFRPGFALTIYRRFGVAGGRVLDTSTGYGGRLVGFLASSLGEYVGIDPSTKTHDGNERLAAALSGQKTVRLLNKPAEDVELDEVGPETCDLAFTSPPYFRKEHYADEPTQSWKRYGEPKAWRDGFLRPMLALQFGALKSKCHAIINIADVLIGAKTVPLVEWTIEAAQMAGFESLGAESFPMSNRFGKGDQGGIAAEPVLLFRKP